MISQVNTQPHLDSHLIFLVRWWNSMISISNRSYIFSYLNYCIMWYINQEMIHSMSEVIWMTGLVWAQIFLWMRWLGSFHERRAKPRVCSCFISFLLLFCHQMLWITKVRLLLFSVEWRWRERLFTCFDRARRGCAFVYLWLNGTVKIWRPKCIRYMSWLQRSERERKMSHLQRREGNIYRAGDRCL